MLIVISKAFQLFISINLENLKRKSLKEVKLFKLIFLSVFDNEHPKYIQKAVYNIRENRLISTVIQVGC